MLNLGGFANLTLLPPAESEAEVIGFDTGPANALLDAWHARHRGGRYDPDGAWAASGRVDEILLERLLAEPFFHRPPPRSTGREVFHLDWLEGHLTGKEEPQDVQATLAELTATSVALGIEMARELAGAPPASALIRVAAAPTTVICSVAWLAICRKPRWFPAATGVGRPTGWKPAPSPGSPGAASRGWQATCPASPALRGHAYLAVSMLPSQQHG